MKQVILKLIRPLLIWIAEVKLTFSYPGIKEDCLQEIKAKIKPGMIFLTYERGALSNLINRGKWKHAAIYVGNGLIVEATHVGVKKTQLDNFCLSKDKVIILKPRFCGPLIMKQASFIALGFVGKEYDFMFSVNNKSKYCVEVVVESYQEVANNYYPRFTEIAGEKTYTPDDIYFDQKSWEIVFDSVSWYRED